MSKLIGVITAWSAEPFIEPAIKQALDYCDEVIVSVSSHHPKLNKFEDNTMDICMKYKNDIHITDGNISNIQMHGYSKGQILKKMLDETNNNKSGNWLAILDADEFYYPEDISSVKDIIKEDKFKRIQMPEKTFVVNTKHHANWFRDRFKKIITDNTSFWTNDMGYEKDDTPYILETDKGMHHYTFLMNPYFKKEFWTIEYGGANQGNQPKKWGWIDNIYLDMDLNDQIKSVEKCKQLGYGNSVLGHFSFKCKEDGTLFTFEGKHPPHIEESGLTEIDDFRKIYKP